MQQSRSQLEPVILCGRNLGALEKCKGEPAFDWLFDNYSYPFHLNRNSCNFNYSRGKIQICSLNSAFYSFISITPTQYRTKHSQAQWKLHNIKIYTHYKIQNPNYMGYEIDNSSSDVFVPIQFQAVCVITVCGLVARL